jgi:hypothetical protein
MLEYNKLFETILYYFIFIANIISKFSIIKCFFSKKQMYKDDIIFNDKKIPKFRIYKFKGKYYRTEEINIIYRFDDVKFLNDDGPITF